MCQRQWAERQWAEGCVLTNFGSFRQMAISGKGRHGEPPPNRQSLLEQVTQGAAF